MRSLRNLVISSRLRWFHPQPWHPRVWRCLKPSCGVVNNLVDQIESLGKPSCAKCSTPMPVLVSWRCRECGTVSPATSKSCVGCSAKRSQNWNCQTCSVTLPSTVLSCTTCEPNPTFTSCSSCGFQHLPPSSEFCPVCMACVTAVKTPKTDMNPPLAESEAWRCALCGFRNKGTTMVCEQCLEAKDVPVGTLDISSGWTCSQCATLNSESSTECSLCGHGNPKVTKKPLAPGHWACVSCNFDNPPNVNLCISCGEKRQIAAGFWQCVSCLSVNTDARSQCIGCGKPRVKAAVGEPKVTWECDTCSFENHINAANCVKCKAPRTDKVWCCPCTPNSPQVSPVCKFCGGDRSAVWVCGVCRTTNPPTSEACSKCNAKKGFRGKQCKTCATVCSADEDTCPNCGANVAQMLRACGVCGDLSSVTEDPIPECPQCRTRFTGDEVTVPAVWVCPGCGTRKSVTSRYCRDCDIRLHLPSLPVPMWDCPGCNRRNFDFEKVCKICASSQAEGTPVSAAQFEASSHLADDRVEDEDQTHGTSTLPNSPPDVPLQTGAWTCTLCGERNVDDALECVCCGVSRSIDNG